MHATRYVSGLTYLPRQDSSYYGDIGQYSISVSSDGTSWSAPVVAGTWADDKTLKTALFGSVSARFVRLTALTEAGNRGPFSSAAEIGLLGNPAIGPPSARPCHASAGRSRLIVRPPRRMPRETSWTVMARPSGTPPIQGPSRRCRTVLLLTCKARKWCLDCPTCHVRTVP